MLIARGRDAADVAISTTFGQTSLKSFVVTTREVEEERLLRGRCAEDGVDRLRRRDAALAR